MSWKIKMVAMRIVLEKISAQTVTMTTTQKSGRSQTTHYEKHPVTRGNLLMTSFRRIFPCLMTTGRSLEVRAKRFPWREKSAVQKFVEMI